MMRDLLRQDLLGELESLFDVKDIESFLLGRATQVKPAILCNLRAAQYALTFEFIS